MANTYSKLYVHFVFAVKNRQSLITKDFKAPLHKYITGIVTKHGQKMIIIDGYKDHVHMLVGCTTSVRFDDMMREVKEHSTRWVNDNRLAGGKFSWQSGYAVFSVASWNFQTIYDYIANQEEHHRTKSFREEYIKFLEDENVDYDPRYLFYNAEGAE